jgi:metal-responsive CopG/Arc/MetJ family transcriptional regulator
MKLANEANRPDKLTAFRLPTILLQTVDTICVREDLTRSQIFRRCITDYVKARGFEVALKQERTWSPELYNR